MTLNTIDKTILLDFTQYFGASSAARAADALGIENKLDIKEDSSGNGYVSVSYYYNH